MNSYLGRAGQILNYLQSGFVSLLRLWSIPIVFMLSVASGYTTYFGMTRFITDWIALIITIAVQSIIVICTLEIATIHWKANRIRYFVSGLSLFVSLCVSISFSYFKFYEISQTQAIRLHKLFELHQSVDEYLNRVYETKTKLLAEQREKTKRAERDTSLAYMGKHPDMASDYKGLVGKGIFWKHFNEFSTAERQRLVKLEDSFVTLDQSIAQLRQTLRGFEFDSVESKKDYQLIIGDFSMVQKVFDELVTGQGHRTVNAPLLPPFEKIVQTINPSFSMWEGFSWFAFLCAVMVDFLTIVLSYRLEANAPGTLSDSEQEIAYHCLGQFTEFSINRNDELEVKIEKSRIEKARRYPDWMRLFGASLLLNRGFLRKVDQNSVEFAPNLYPIIAKVMSKRAAESDRPKNIAQQTGEEENQSFDRIVKGMFRG